MKISKILRLEERYIIYRIYYNIWYTCIYTVYWNPYFWIESAWYDPVLAPSYPGLYFKTLRTTKNWKFPSVAFFDSEEKLNWSGIRDHSGPTRRVGLGHRTSMDCRKLAFWFWQKWTKKSLKFCAFLKLLDFVFRSFWKMFLN